MCDGNDELSGSSASLMVVTGEPHQAETDGGRC